MKKYYILVISVILLLCISSVYCKSGTEWEEGRDYYYNRGIYWGENTDQKYTCPGIDYYCWYEKNSAEEIHPAGQKMPNSFGLYDMNGNVWEWCWDWYDESYYSVSPCSNPAGPSSGVFRVVRGGSWSDCARKCRSAERGGGSPAYFLYTPGFRPVRRD